MADYSRIIIEHANHQKINIYYDFAFAEYISTRQFFDDLSSVQADLLDDGIVTLNTGQTVSADNPGGLIAIQIYMETIESTRQTMSGLSKLGLNVEKQLWKNI
jgi:hypothetical protein